MSRRDPEAFKNQGRDTRVGAAPRRDDAPDVCHDGGSRSGREVVGVLVVAMDRQARNLRGANTISTKVFCEVVGISSS